VQELGPVAGVTFVRAKLCVVLLSVGENHGCAGRDQRVLPVIRELLNLRGVGGVSW
jgi:hypothetical protein